jgi:purine catabolism regulator
VRFEDFDLGTFMVSEIPPERLAPKVEEILSVLRANPALREAVCAYFDHDLDIAATAAGLHMHRNSLRYRLARLERLLGRSLKQPATIAALYVALAADAAAANAPARIGGMPKPAP